MRKGPVYVSGVLFFLALLLLSGTGIAGAEMFRFAQVEEGVYAGIARPGAATSNVFFVVGDLYVVAGGAHLNKKGVKELRAAVAAVTPKPIRYFILPHHHQGYTGVDFDFPPETDVLMSWQTWQGLQEESRKVPYPVLFYSDGLTLSLGGRTIVLSNVEQGHTEGDTLVFLPESGVLFASDLLYFDCVGYLGSGHMQGWALALELIAQIGAKKIIPGFGPVGSNADAAAYKIFFKDFLTEILRHIEAGDSLERTLRTFSLPRHESLDGYKQFLRVNIERAYRDLKATLQG